MEGLRDAALADYESLPDEEKAQIHYYFKQIIIANGSSSVSDYIEFLRTFHPHVDEILQNCEGYEEGRLDFNNYITVKYVLEKHAAVRCDGCSSMILGRPYFSCYECCFAVAADSYDLCTRCYRSKKFEDHEHKQFYDNQKLLSLCSMVVAEKKELETRNHRINRAVIEFAGKFSDFARSITTDGLRLEPQGVRLPIDLLGAKPSEYGQPANGNLDRVLDFDKNKKLGRYSKEPGQETLVNSAMATLRLEPQEVRPRIDLLGAKPSEYD